MKNKFKATKWFHPYLHEKKMGCLGGKSKLYAPITLKSSGAGVYLIKKGKKIIYVGMSGSDVKKTLYRHFQAWTDKRSRWNESRRYIERVSYYEDFRNCDYLVKVIFTFTSEDAAILEELMIKKIKPVDNKAKLNIYTERQYLAVNSKYNEAEIVPSTWEDVPF